MLPHPLGGNMVFVGTGRLFETADASSTAEQTLYGIWDKVGTGAGTSADIVRNNELMVTQTISALTIDGKSGNYFGISSNGVDYGTGSDTAKKRGWKIRMTIAPGQRMIYAPQIKSGRVIFDTMVPGGIAASCKATQPESYTFVLDPFTGAPGRDGPTFDTNGDGLFTAADNATAGAVHGTSVGPSEAVSIPGTTNVGLEGANGSEKAHLGGTPFKRQWRQLTTPPAY